MKRKPFCDKSLNDLESFSLLIVVITVYCGIYFLSDIPEEYYSELP